MTNPPTRVPAPYRGGQMYTHWARPWPPLSRKPETHLHCGCPLAPRSTCDLESTQRAYTASLGVTNLAADHLQDPQLFKIILDKVCTKPTTAPTSTSLVYLLGMWKLRKSNLRSHEQGPSQQGTLGFGVDYHLQCAVLKVSFGVCHMQGERQDSSALVNLLPSLWYVLLGHNHPVPRCSKAVDICQQ